MKPLDHLSLHSLLRLLAAMALVLAPHLARVPIWEAAAIAALLAWRALAGLRQWPLPGATLRALLTFAAFVGVIASYGRINGQNAGTALLVMMAALKLLEMRARRDVMVTVCLMYFILVTHFLFSQEIWTIAYLLGCTVAITAVLVDANHAGSALPPKLLLRLGARMTAYALPLMLVMFVLFPRIPGPLWGLPADSGAERSGLPDSMSPGGLSQLILSNEVSFRVKFLGKPPPMRERYWRGPVLDFFDGREWKSTATRSDVARHEVQFEGEPVRYEIILEPQRHPWLLALDLPSPEALPPKSTITRYHQLVAREDVRERLMYQAISYPHYRLEPQLSPQARAAALQMNTVYNPRAHALAAQWRDQGLSPEALSQRVLAMFREQPFHYTLNPPETGRDGVDDFLFKTQRGFCQHYASAYTVLMRAAGVPARVVTGYQGGVMNEFGDYYVVRQSDAHAWSEYWVEGRGWVRVDPTAAVSPDRVEKGFDESAGRELHGGYLRRGNALFTVQAGWDALNNAWNRAVLAYGPELQGEFLARFGLHDWSDMILALTVLTTGILGVVGLLLLRQFAPAANDDVALRLWRQVQRALRRRLLEQAPDEGPRDFAQRVQQALPAAAQPMQRALDAYLALRYLQEPAPALQDELREAVRALRRRLVHAR